MSKMHKDNRGKKQYNPYGNQFEQRMKEALSNAANLNNLNKKNKK